MNNNTKFRLGIFILFAWLSLFGSLLANPPLRVIQKGPPMSVPDTLQTRQTENRTGKAAASRQTLKTTVKKSGKKRTPQVKQQAAKQ
jgi:hypothetical protein